MQVMEHDANELPPRLLDITTLAHYLGVNTRHVRRLVAERRIPSSNGATSSASTLSRSASGSTTSDGTRVHPGSAADPRHTRPRTMSTALGPRRSIGLEAP